MPFAISTRTIQAKAGTTTLAADLAAINAAVAGKLASSGNGSALTGLTISQIADLTGQLSGKLGTSGNGSSLTGLTISQIADLASQLSSLSSAIGGKANEAHSHGLSDVAGLVDALNNLGAEIDALGSGGGPTWRYVFPADDTRAYSAGVYQTIHTTPTLAAGCYSIYSLVNHVRPSAAAMYQRWQASGGIALGGAVNDPIGHCVLEGVVSQVTVAATGTWTSSAPARSSSGAGASHMFHLGIEVTTAGTLALQHMFNGTGNVTIKKGSLIELYKIT